MLKQLTELGETLVCVYWFMIKNIAKGIDEEMPGTGRGEPPSQGTPPPGIAHVHLSRRTLSLVLCGFVEASLHKHDWLHH